jgi:sulfite reductase beta subunit-like hemoprotein
VTRPAKHREEGQWALDGREPLDTNEQTKNDGAPLNVRARIENIYTRQGFVSIDKTDRVARNFVEQRHEGERFATWAVRADEADLR